MAPIAMDNDEQQHLQGLTEFRERYLAADDAGRLAAREYVNKLAKLASNFPLAEDDQDILIFTLRMGASEGSVPRMNMPARLLARAIAAWDRGDTYPPDAVDIL